VVRQTCDVKLFLVFALVVLTIMKISFVCLDVSGVHQGAFPDTPGIKDQSDVPETIELLQLCKNVDEVRVEAGHKLIAPNQYRQKMCDLANSGVKIVRMRFLSDLFSVPRLIPIKFFGMKMHCGVYLSCLTRWTVPCRCNQR
jgi:hypothetical protein